MFTSSVERGAEAPASGACVAVEPAAGMWSNWCRLCAREPATLPLSPPDAGATLETRVSKYLHIQVQAETNPDFPNVICQDCSDVLSSFDTYALQCVKVQSLYRTLLERKEPFADLNSCRSFRDDYMDYSSIGYHKLIPLCSIKDEEDIPTGEIESSLLKAILLNKNAKNQSKLSYRIKNESDNEIFDEEEHSFSDEDSVDNEVDDEDDHIPLSNISSLQINNKRKSKKLKILPKSKRKKMSKKVKLEEIEEILIRDVDIKTEPLSDEENINRIDGVDVNKVEKKKKRERQIINDSIISFACHICRENCKNWHALCRHFTDVHNARAEVQCCCGKYLASRVSIGRHCASHGKLNSFNCTKCSKRFPRASELETHMVTHLPKEEYPYVCCKCAKRFSTPQLLKHHEKKHIPMEERPTHICKFCKSKFASKSSLAMHIQTVHERLKNFVCDQCGCAFATKGILEEHLARHSDTRAHICTICQKSFKTKQRLAIHQDTHNDTVYQCPHCPMQLNSRRTLRMHLYVHDEILRYQCTDCDKAFRRAKDLKNHSNIHSGRRPYACMWCSRTFANGSNCRAHKRRMHPNELRMFDEIQEKKHHIKASIETITDEINGVSPSRKVIHATVKRKTDHSQIPKVPLFTYGPDVSDKIENIFTELKPVQPDIQPKNDSSTNPKPERSSPIANYESSLSPLNLNTATSNKFVNKDNAPAFSIAQMTQDYETIPNFPENTDCYVPVPIAIIQNIGKKDAYPETGYKAIPEQVMNKNTQMFPNYSENNIQNVYGNNPVTSLSATFEHPYEIQFERNCEN